MLPASQMSPAIFTRSKWCPPIPTSRQFPEVRPSAMTIGAPVTSNPNP